MPVRDGAERGEGHVAAPRNLHFLNGSISPSRPYLYVSSDCVSQQINSLVKNDLSGRLSDCLRFSACVRGNAQEEKREPPIQLKARTKQQQKREEGGTIFSTITIIQ